VGGERVIVMAPVRWYDSCGRVGERRGEVHRRLIRISPTLKQALLLDSLDLINLPQ